MGEYPHESVYMLQNFINNNMETLNYQRLSAASLTFVHPDGCDHSLYPIQRYFRGGEENKWQKKKKKTR
ncbi:MAG: hypothetical protein ACLRXC_12200 [[Clostridium] leptum]